MPKLGAPLTFTEDEIGILFASLIVYPAHCAHLQEAGGPEYTEEAQDAWRGLMIKLFPEGIRPQEATRADFPRELESTDF